MAAFEQSLTFDLGVLEYRQGNYDKAADIMETIVEKYPDNFRAKYYLAITYVKLKKFQKAQDIYVEIIAKSEDESLKEYSRKGLKYLDPKFYKKFKKNNFQIVDVPPEKPEVKKVVEAKPHKPAIIEQKPEKPRLKPELKLNSAQQTIVKQVAQEHKVSQAELNNLLRVLAENPSALKTINKLTQSGSSSSSGGYDKESVAKLIKMLTMNTQMGMLNFDKNSQNNNNGNDMMSLMMGMNGGMNGMNGMNGNNNNFANMMNYLSDPSNKEKMNPQMIDSLIKNSMGSGFGMGGF